MSRSIKSKVAAGREWWGKRPLSTWPVSRKHGMKDDKRILHKMERKQGQAQVREQIED